MRTGAWLLLLSLAQSLGLPAETPRHAMLAVACGNTVLFVDPSGPSRGESLGNLTRPQSLAVSRDGHWLAAAPAAGDQVELVDLTQKKLVRTLKSDSLTDPAGLAFSGDGARLWVLSRGVKALSEIALASGQVTRVLPLEGPEPESLACDPSGRRLLILCKAGYLSEVDGEAWKVLKTENLKVPLAAAAWWGPQLLLAGGKGARIFDAGRKRAVMVPAPSQPLGAASAGELGLLLCRSDLLALKPDGRQAWSLPGLPQPALLTVSPDGKLAVLAHPDSHDLEFVDTAQGREVARLALPGAPAAMAWLP